MLTDVAVRAADYLDGLGGRSVWPTADALAELAAFDGPLPTTGTDPTLVLDELDCLGSPATVASAGGRYFGFVTGGTLPAALAAGWLSMAWDQNGALSVMSPIAAALDRVALGWVVEVLGLPAETSGVFVTGATMANVCGLAAARHRVLADVGWDVDADGLFGAPPITVVVGAEAHSTLPKALGMLGLGRRRVLTVPADEQGRLMAEALPAVDGAVILCLQAGNVNSGASDPFGPAIAWAREVGAWVHVDGAFGLWAAASPKRRHLVAGVADADSWATDGHKWLNVSYDCGIALTRHPGDLAAAMSATAAYLPAGGREPMNLSPQSSQRARGVEVWAALRSLGRAGVTDLVDRCCDHAAALARGLAAGGAEVLNDVVLNQVVVTFGDDDRTDRVIAAVQADGTCWAGSTVWRGRRAMRISVSSWATTEVDIARTIDAMLRCGRNS